MGKKEDKERQELMEESAAIGYQDDKVTVDIGSATEIPNPPADPYVAPPAVEGLTLEDSNQTEEAQRRLEEAKELQEK